ncbi:MAG: hypothetical protein AB7I04_07890 [Pseudomonadales bacterium]
MRRVPIQKPLALLLLLASIAGCAALPQPEVHAPLLDVPPGYEVPPGAGTLYRIDRADLTLHTYRAGWLSGLAHNHVMETDTVRGDIRLSEPLSASAARLYFRPWDLVLDDPDARAAAGPGFESERTAADIAATRTRMLGPRGFDSNDHPFVVADVRWADETALALTLHFRDRQVEVRAPAQWQISAQRIDASAGFDIDHTELGIRPYSAFAGAIAVAEPIRVRIVLSALRVSPL